MSLIVTKFGGSSVSDAAAVRRVAERIAHLKREGNDVVVVVSAMGDTTDELIDLATDVAGGDGPLRSAPRREMDILLTAGERISMALLAIALSTHGVAAKSFTGQQAGVRTDAHYGDARILDVLPERLEACLEEGGVAIVAGFQGVNVDLNDVTTLGRGGSDTTAVAIAAALGADLCEIYTDVDGVFTADPRIVPSARRIETVTSEEMLELAAHGAKILHLRAVEYARRHGVELHVRSSFSMREGTRVVSREEVSMEAPIISGVAHDRSQAKITCVGVPDVPGAAARLFEVVATSGANIDMIVQNISVQGTGRTDISFTLPAADVEKVQPALDALADELGYSEVLHNPNVGKLSLVGAGMRSHPGVSARLFGALRDANINIEMISTSEIRISVVTKGDELDDAVRAVHSAFDLDADEVEAVVYGGTGR